MDVIGRAVPGSPGPILEPTGPALEFIPILEGRNLFAAVPGAGIICTGNSLGIGYDWLKLYSSSSSSAGDAPSSKLWELILISSLLICNYITIKKYISI
jgi:hypothetical protein